MTTRGRQDRKFTTALAANNTTGGPIGGVFGGMGSNFRSPQMPNIIADGNNLIFSYNIPGSSAITYFCLKNNC